MKAARRSFTTLFGLTVAAFTLGCNEPIGESEVRSAGVRNLAEQQALVVP